MKVVALVAVGATALAMCGSGCGGAAPIPGTRPPSGSEGGSSGGTVGPDGMIDGTGGGSGSGGGGGGGGNSDGGMPAQTVTDAAGSPHLCSDLFDQTKLQTFSVDISADEWAKLQDEFLNHIDLVLQGVQFQTYHPITFHYGNETVTDAMMRLKGQSSWVQTVQIDGAASPPHPKAQFVIAFDQINPNGKFHGVSKLDIDMPRSDFSFMHERLANNWFRKLGIMAPCSNSAKLVINGQLYGVYVNEESIGGHLIKTYFPLNANGDMWKGGDEIQTNKLAPNNARRNTWAAANDIPSMLAIVDLPNSVLEWAGDALITNGDGFYGGNHNWFIYDEGGPGFVYLPADTDATFDWLSLNSSTPNMSVVNHPIYWWAGRPSSNPPDPHYLVVINDPTWRQHYIDAIATQLSHWDVQQFQSWIDTWSAQIADAVAADPNKAARTSDFQHAVSVARQMVSGRPAFLQTFLDCENGQGGADNDGDGVKWCNDCNDNNAAVYPGEPEL